MTTTERITRYPATNGQHGPNGHKKLSKRDWMANDNWIQPVARTILVAIIAILVLLGIGNIGARYGAYMRAEHIKNTDPRTLRIEREIDRLIGQLPAEDPPDPPSYDQ